MTEIDKPPYQRGYEAGHHDGLAEGMRRASAAYEAGRLAAIRAEVERALEDLADDVESQARESRGFMWGTLRHMKGHRRMIFRRGHYTPKAGYELGRGIGLWTRWEKARRQAVGRLDQTRRWLQETS